MKETDFFPVEYFNTCWMKKGTVSYLTADRMMTENFNRYIRKILVGTSVSAHGDQNKEGSTQSKVILSTVCGCNELKWLRTVTHFK